MIVTALIYNDLIYLGCADENNGKIIFKTAISTVATNTVTDYSISISIIFQSHKIAVSDVNGGIVASVVPQVTATVKNAITEVFNVHVIEVGPGVKSGVDTRVENPTLLGADMLVGAAAAIAEYEPPIIVVNICTNTTISVIDRSRRFIGRIITTGIKNSFDTISDTSPLIGSLPIKTPERIIGSTTEKAVQSGVIYGSAFTVDGMIEAIKKEQAFDTVNVIMTGEYAPLIAPLCSHKIISDYNLMTKGLIRIYSKNMK